MRSAPPAPRSQASSAAHLPAARAAHPVPGPATRARTGGPGPALVGGGASALLALTLAALAVWASAAALPWQATPFALLLAAVVVVADLRPVGVGRRPGPRHGVVPLSWGLVVALTALAPLSLVLLAHCAPVAVRRVRRGAGARTALLAALAAAVGVLTCRVVVCLLVGAPLGGGAVLTSPHQWPAVLVAGVAGLVLEGLAVAAGRTVLGRPRRSRSCAPHAGSLSGPLLTAAVVASAPVVAVSAAGGVLLLGLVCLPLGASLVSAAAARRHERRALVDDLTGLANRESLLSSTARALRSGPGGGGPGLLVVALDHFEDVDDTPGHPVGDALLREVAERLVGMAPPDTLVARLGGDEFALLVADGTRAEALARAVLEEMARPLQVGELQVVLPASVGVALAPEDGTSAPSLLESADAALHRAKEVRGRACTCAGQRDVDSVERLRLLADLGRAVDRDELYVEYQPQVVPGNGLVVGAEALVRWRHPALGAVPPDRFIPLAEQSGLVGAITAVVLERALADLATWRAEGFRGTVSVNLSARLLSDADLPARVGRALARHQVDASALVLEVTETGIVSDPHRAGAVVRGLRLLGCSVAVDDYGTGQCSLAYLTALDVDELKIDRSFVTAMTTDRTRAVIVRSTVAMARELGLRVVAEGVEDARTQQALADLDCHLAQGEHVGRPVASEDVLSRLRRQARARFPELPPVPVVAPRAPLTLET